MTGIDVKLGRIASKIKSGTEVERLATAKELNMLAVLLIDMNAGEIVSSPAPKRGASATADSLPFNAEEDYA